MAEINYKHLRYFWMVGKLGSIAKASEKLFISPQSISAQLTELEESLGCVLFRKVGRGLQLSDYGRQIFNYAEEIFSIGSELSSFIENRQISHREQLRIGITDCITKSAALNLMEPIFEDDYNIRLNCKQGKLNDLISELCINRLDVVISDREVQESINTSVFNHNLGSSPLAVYGSKQLITTIAENAVFPEMLHGANFLMPGDQFHFKELLVKWFETNKISPLIVAEFDDSVMMKLFGQRGHGFFVAPYSLRNFICTTFQVELIGVIDSVHEKIYAITTERRVNHPGMLRVIKSRMRGFETE